MRSMPTQLIGRSYTIVMLLALAALGGVAGCVTTRPTPESAEQAAVDYVYIAVRYPAAVQPYMHRFRQAIAASDQYQVSEISPRSGGYSFDIRLAAAVAGRSYAFVTYAVGEQLVTIAAMVSAAVLVELLTIPAALFPPPAANLSRAEVIEFYRWQFAGALAEDEIAPLLDAVTVTVAIEPRRRAVSTALQRADISLFSLLTGASATVWVQYPQP